MDEDYEGSWEESPHPFYGQDPPRSLRDIEPPKLAPKELQKLAIEDIPYTQGNVNQLKDWHRIFAEMQLMGKRNKDIAAELQVHEMTLAKVQRSPVYKVYIKDLRKQAEEDSVFDVAEHLRRVTPKTFETMYDLMVNAESETVRASMVKEYADRINPKINKFQSESKSTIYLESDTIKMLAQNLIESCKDLTDVSFEGKTDEEVIDILEQSVEGDKDEDPKRVL